MKWCSRGSFSQSAGAVKWFLVNQAHCARHLTAKCGAGTMVLAMSVATAVAAFILLVGIMAANMLVKLNININIKE